MKRLVVPVVLGLLSSINANPQSLHDAQREGLQRPVRTVETESWETMSMGNLQSEVRKRKLDSLAFNRDGRLVQRVLYDDYGFLFGTERYSHNTDGDIVQTELTNEKGHLEEKRVYNYQLGKIKEILTYGANGSLTLKEVYQYDAAGHLIEQRYFARGKSKVEHSSRPMMQDTRLTPVSFLPLVHTSRRPLYGDKPDESVRRIIKTRKITYYPQ